MRSGRSGSPAGRRASLLTRMTTEARSADVTVRRIHLVVAIDRLLARLLVSTPPGSWVVKGGYANQLRRPDSARFTEDLDLKVDAAIETAPELLAAAFAVDLTDDFSYEVGASARPLVGPPGGGLRFVVVTRLSGTELVSFKVDVSVADVVVGELEEYLSDPAVERLGFTSSKFPVYPIAQHIAEKLHALTLPRNVENTRARDLVDLAWFIRHFTLRSGALIDACAATFIARSTHPWPPTLPDPPAAWERPYENWRKQLDLADATPSAATASVVRFLEPVLAGVANQTWSPATQSWSG